MLQKHLILKLVSLVTKMFLKYFYIRRCLLLRQLYDSTIHFIFSCLGIEIRARIIYKCWNIINWIDYRCELYITVLLVITIEAMEWNEGGRLDPCWIRRKTTLGSVFRFRFLVWLWFYMVRLQFRFFDLRNHRFQTPLI